MTYKVAKIGRNYDISGESERLLGSRFENRRERERERERENTSRLLSFPLHYSSL